jgi:Ser/Thr protein kinase RdoA (MazF antagonist)
VEDGGPLASLPVRRVIGYRRRVGFRAQALLEFDLPAAPQRVDELPSPTAGASLCRVQTPAGSFLLVCSDAALGTAFETTFFDLLSESRYPAPRPRRAKSGALIAMMKDDGHSAAAACYGWPPGEPVDPARAAAPQLLEVGRLLARLHQIGEAHPASVVEPLSCRQLAAQLPDTREAAELREALSLDLATLPAGAAHGHLGPGQALFLGARCSAVLPSGAAHSGALVLDLARCAAAWATSAREPLAALRAVASGYQALRRLGREEREALPRALRSAAAREGAIRILRAQPDALEPLHIVERLGEREVRDAAG